ncbi:MAG TPA: prepilin-type N-terminal cleavage/methylation domain-containing protein [Polyangiaceae bacterium]|nr:prepilin-type N-terminal cleavage/methylation domain-containing protein [Polyangiaceae bacterium]
MNRGFTLLEVLMAVAILGLGLSVLLGAQTGLFANATRTENISLATGLARCRMSEVELELLQKGFPLVEADGEGPCCMDQPSDGFTCSWKVQRVVLPQMGMNQDGGVDSGIGPGLNLGAGLDLSSPSGGGPLGMLMQLQAGKNGLGEKPDMSSLATQLTGSMGGVDGIASMAMGMVYPTLKPMLEASIRKAIISVHWHEGSKERTLDITQYITSPQQALPDGGLGDGGMMPGMGGPGTPGFSNTFGGTGLMGGGLMGGSGLMGGFGTPAPAVTP